MEKSKVYLFTSVTCPHCPDAREFLDELATQRKDILPVDVSMNTKEGQALAKECNVMAVPTFLIKGPGYKDNIGVQGTPRKEFFNKLIDLSQGKTTEEALRAQTT